MAVGEVTSGLESGTGPKLRMKYKNVQSDSKTRSGTVSWRELQCMLCDICSV